MSMLFKVEGKVVTPHTETLLIEPFKTIWERDTSPTKEAAMEDFKYIEFTTSMLKTNPYRGYDEDKREAIVIEQSITRDDWMVDDLLIRAKNMVIEFQEEASATYSFFMSSKRGVEKMKHFFDTFDINAVNIKNGNPIYKPRDITSALKDTNDILAKYNAMQEKVEQELFEVTKNRGMKLISPFADPNSI